MASNFPNVLFVLPVGGGSGGANSVVQETVGLRRLGVSAAIAVTNENQARFLASYPELHQARVQVSAFGDPRKLGELMQPNQIVCATTNGSVKTIQTAIESRGPELKVRLAYYVQDYEPLFYPHGSELWNQAYRSYSLLPNCALMAKTQWLCDMVYANHGIRVTKVRPSIDHDIYYPDLGRSSAGLSVVAMLRPSTPRRAPRRTARILNILADRLGNDISLQVFGCTDKTILDAGLRLSPRVINHGQLRRMDVPPLLRAADMFLDLSDYQAFGRTGLEGMACGSVPVLPVLGGSAEYAVDGRNAFVIDTRSDEEVLNAVNRFVGLTPAERMRMRMEALQTASDFTVTRAALSELEFFQGLVQ